MFSFKSLLVISCFIMVFSSSDAGVIDDADHVSPEELQDYINQLQDYIQIKETSFKKRTILFETGYDLSQFAKWKRLLLLWISMFLQSLWTKLQMQHHWSISKIGKTLIEDVNHGFSFPFYVK
ncbi:unnamed protein product [Lepeophtheirus salmonis]|uniref:(salmon louse) hypothetical protein n=1 Tax=Lepeophtheirus salmonis TaxID=72036 RepID=A0A7R8CQN6_LEPSM|nr:unnamed protein product [Lepeophtheirus salmonis]CAF2897301.1 unnamed protein product [Lepeophtheirus salmonis]